MKSKFAAGLKVFSFSLFSIACFVSMLAIWMSLYEAETAIEKSRIALLIPVSFVPAVIVYLLAIVLEHGKEIFGEKPLSESLKKNEKWLGVIALVVVGGVIGFLAVTAYFTDRESLEEVTERENMEVIDDVNIKQPISNKVQDQIDSTNRKVIKKVAAVDLVPVSTSTKYELNYKNLASGKIAISSSYGFLFFKDGVATECYSEVDPDRRNNGYNYSYDCEDFYPGVIEVFALETYGPRSVEFEPGSVTDTLVVFQENVQVDGQAASNIYLVKIDEYYRSGYERMNVYSIPNKKLQLYSNRTNQTIEASFIPGFTRKGYSSAQVYDAVILYVNGKRNDIVLKYELSRHGGYYLQDYMRWDGEQVTSLVGDYRIGFLPTEYNIGYGYGYVWSGDRTKYAAPYPNSVDEKYEALPQEVKEAGLYFKESCEMPYSFADYSVSVKKANNKEYYPRMLFKISDPGDNEIYYLTTALYGYDPEKWGTVIDEVGVDSYYRAVQTGIPFNGYPTETLNIAGVPVRYTLPRLPARPCEKKTYMQYQWVKDGSLFTLEVSYRETDEFNTEHQKFINQTIADLITNTKRSTLADVAD